jgi:hypothetical protein
MLITMKGDIATLIERTENLQDDVRQLHDAFEVHRRATEKSRTSMAFLKGEWKTVMLAIGLVVEHFWNASKVH